MAANRKLTPLLARRTIQVTTSQDNTLDVTFTDGSVMHIKLAQAADPGAPQPKTVKKVRQTGNLLQLDFDDGSTQAIQLAAPTSSVMLRAADGSLEYAD